MAAGGEYTEAVKLFGMTAYVDLNWSKRWTSSIGYSFDTVDNTSFQSAAAFHRGQYASVNLLWHAPSNFFTGAELLWGKKTDNAGNSGTDEGLVVIHLRLRQRGLGTCLLGRQKCRDAQLTGLLCRVCSVERALSSVHHDLQLLYVPLGHNAGIAPLQFALDLQLINSLLMSAFGFLDLTFRFKHVRLRRQHCRINFRDLPPRGLQGSFLLGAVQPEYDGVLCDWSAEVKADLCNTARGFGKDGDRPEEQIR